MTRITDLVQDMNGFYVFKFKDEMNKIQAISNMSRKSMSEALSRDRNRVRKQCSNKLRRETETIR